MQIKPYLFDAAGRIRTQPLDVSSFADVIQKHRTLLLSKVKEVFRQGWPKSDVEVVADALLEDYLDNMSKPVELGFAVDVDTPEASLELTID